MKAGRPMICPQDKNVEEAERFISEHGIRSPFVVIAPGTAWQTKQYPINMMAQVIRQLSERFGAVVLTGGKNDAATARTLSKIGSNVISAAGIFSIMTSAEIIRRSSLLVANDSAPVHIASAFNTPTVAIFGPTVKDFGFYPYHDRATVVEVEGISCRPCSIHGGKRCPIGTFGCMKRISPDEVVAKALEIAEK